MTSYTGTTLPTFTAGQVVTAAQLNAMVAILNDEVGSWDNYTPAWTSTGTAPTVGNGSIIGRYLQIGKTVQFNIQLTLGSTSSVGTGNYFLSMPPVASTSTPQWTFEGLYFDTSAGANYSTVLQTVTPGSASSPMRILGDATTAGNALRNYSATVPVVPATGDYYFVTGTYEAA